LYAWNGRHPYVRTVVIGVKEFADILSAKIQIADYTRTNAGNTNAYLAQFSVPDQ
jgi:hypothetical protein